MAGVAEVFGIGAVFWFKDLASTQIRKAGMEVDKLKTKLAGMKDYNIAMSRGVTTLAQGIMPGVLGLAAIAVPHLLAASVAKLDEQIFMVGKTANATEDQIKQIRSAIFDLSATSKFSTMDVTKGMYEITSSGYDATQAIQLMQNTITKYALISGESLQGSAELITNAMSAFRVPANEASKLTDMMIEIQNRTKVHYGELQNIIAEISGPAKAANQSLSSSLAVLAAFRNVGISASESATKIKTFYRVMAQPNMAEFAHSIGLNIVDATGNFRNFGDIMIDMDKKMREHGLNAYGRQFAVTKIFGRRGYDVLKQLETMQYQQIKNGITTVYTGFEALKKLQEDLEKNSVGLTDKRSAEQQELLINQWLTLKNAVVSTFQEMGEIATPQTLALVKNLREVTKSVRSFVTDYPEVIKGFFSVLSTAGKLALIYANFKLVTGVFRITSAELFKLKLYWREATSAMTTSGTATGAATAKQAALNTQLATTNAQLMGAPGRFSRLGGSIKAIGKIPVPGILETAVYAGLIYSVEKLIVTYMELYRQLKKTEDAIKNMDKTSEMNMDRLNKKYGTKFTDPVLADAVRAGTLAVKRLPKTATSEERDKVFLETYRKSIVNYAEITHPDEQFTTAFGAVPRSMEKQRQSIVDEYMYKLTQQQGDLLKAIQASTINLHIQIDGKDLNVAVDRASQEEAVRSGRTPGAKLSPWRQGIVEGTAGLSLALIR
jgi:TP901 family phage tail tape measure protein